MALRKDLRVLVVDDTAVSRQVLLQMLEALGVADARATSGGSMAIASMAQFPADVVIADLNMPEMDGLELLKHMRGDRRSSDVRFILASGDETDKRIDEAWTHGMDRFLSKPFNNQNFVHCIESVAGRI